MASDRQPSALLLLPPPPSASFEKFRDAYSLSISTVFSKLSQKLNGSNRAVLDVALCIPGLLSRSSPWAKVFARLQSLLANAYRLAGIIASEKKVELDVPGGIDVRVIFVDSESATEHKQTSLHGPVLELQTLATSARSWDAVLYLGNSTGQKLATAFSQFYQAEAATMQQIPNSDWTVPEATVPENDLPTVPYYSVIVGGTFDHFHIGHKLLLTAMALAMEPVWSADTEKERLLTVGITGDELLRNKKYAEVLESWDERYQSTASFLSAILDFRPGQSEPEIERVSKPEVNGKYNLIKMPGLVLKFVQICDPFGPTITEESITALIVSKETRAGGVAVNDERAKKNWKPLDVFEVDVLHSGDVPMANEDDFASKISSTDIRRRQMGQSESTR